MDIFFKEVSVVVSTYTTERLNYVLSCMESLKKQTLPPKEIILVLDPNKTLIEFYKSRIPNGIRIIFSEGYGLSYARNAGIRNANAEIIAFIDDDAVADEKWLENLVKNYDDPDVVGAGGLVKPIWKSGRPIWFPEELDWIVGCSYKGLPKRKAYVRNPIGCNMSFRKNVFEKVGYFETRIGRIGKKLVAGEEADLSLRILKKIPDSKIVHDPSSVVYHTVPSRRATVRYIIVRSFYEGFSKALISNDEPDSVSALSTEERYLKYLFGNSIRSRLELSPFFRNFFNIVVIFASVSSVLMGYLVRKFLLSQD